jgi:hypothetical protein
MQLTVTGYLSSLSWDASRWETRLYKKYAGNLGYVCKRIWFDVRHGITRDEVIAFFDKIRKDSSYSNIRNSSSIERLNQLERRFINTVPATISTQFYWQ